MSVLTRRNISTIGLCFDYQPLNSQLCFIPSNSLRNFSNDVDSIRDHHNCTKISDLSSIAYFPKDMTMFQKTAVLTDDDSICFTQKDIKLLEKFHIENSNLKEE